MQGQSVQSAFRLYRAGEVGLRGADLGIVVDVTLTGDTPEARALGRRFKIKDRGMLTHPGVCRWMVETARQAGLPYQLAVLEGGTTDAMAMQTTRAGLPVGVLSIPTRYVHTPSEMVDYQGVLNSVRLLVALLHGPAPV